MFCSSCRLHAPQPSPLIGCMNPVADSPVSRAWSVRSRHEKELCRGPNIGRSLMTFDTLHAQLRHPIIE